MSNLDDDRVGKFYRFLPRRSWPLDAQITLPHDQIYYIHPTIILSCTTSGLADVVTITSSPKTSKPAETYIAIDYSPDTLATNSQLPKPSYVVLDSRRTFSVDLLVPFTDPAGHGQYALGSGSTERLVKLVSEYEIRAAGMLSMVVVGKKAARKAERMKKVPLVAVQKNGCHAASVSFPPSLSDASNAQNSLNEVDVQDIKVGLAGLKLAIAALEAQCEKLEHGAAAAAQTEVVPSTTVGGEPKWIPTPPDPQLNPAVHLPASTLGTVPSQSTGEGSINSAPQLTRSSKRSRIQEWFTRLWRKRTGLSLT